MDLFLRSRSRGCRPGRFRTAGPAAALGLTLALIGVTGAPAPADAQDRAAGVRISRGHVYVGGRHVGSIRSFGDRTGLARIVNPWVRASPPPAHRPPDVRASGFGGRRGFVGDGPPRGPGGGRGFTAGTADRFGSDPFGLRHRSRARIGANGILLGGAFPLRTFFPVGVPFCLPHPFLPLLWVSVVEVAAVGSAGASSALAGMAPEPQRDAERSERGAPGAAAFDPRGPGRTHAEREPGGPCVAVTVRMTAGASHWLRVPLSSLGATNADEAAAVLRERLRSGRPLHLEGLVGGLTVPASLVEDIAVEPCPDG